MNSKSLLTKTLVIGTLLACAGFVRANEIVYTNSAGYGPDHVGKYDVDIAAGTATLISTFTLSAGNGRGIVVIGNTMYTTVVDDGNIYKWDATTGASQGSIATGLSSLSTIAYDGTNLWLADYSGTNKAYKLDLAGNLLATISLGNSAGGQDGLEYFNGKLIGNRGDLDAPYDIYSLTGGAPTTSAFIDPAAAGKTTAQTGIAFDGTYFLTSEVYNGNLDVWDGTTGAFVKTISLPGYYNGGLPLYIEDISVDYQTRADTGNVPDGGSTAVLIGSVVLGLLAIRRKK